MKGCRMKSTTVWFFGIFGCAVTGALIGEMIEPSVGPGAGAVVGALLFTFMRLFQWTWLAKSNL
jgi:hypothetical protein